jgi:hypothetical protein
LRRNLSGKGKVLAIGGIVVLGAGAAYALMKSPPAPTTGGGPPPDPRAAKQAECEALVQSLQQLRAQPTPDAANMLRIEGQIATCWREARELGVTIDAAQSHLSNADASFAAIEGWFNEYRATSEHDPLKRNSTRQSILNGGEALAATYVNAVTQSTGEATKMIAQSIVRALDASISRRICFWNGTPGPGGGCGTHMTNEDQPDTKAGQEHGRVVVPLLAAYARAVAKVGGPSKALSDADGEAFLAAILRPSANLKTWIDGQFAHYKATSDHDPLKRNNTRGSILAAGREMAAGLTDVFAQASSFGSLTAMRAVSTLALAALNASIDRWACFFMGQPGCGTFAVNEDQPDVKAQQELAAVTTPLMALYGQIARALVARGDAMAFEPLITAKLRVCKTMKDFIDGQFAHYRATSYIDPLKRNNTRGSILAAGATLAACLQNALSTATGAAKPPARGVSGLLGLGGYVSDGPGLGQLVMMMPVTTGRSLVPTFQASIAARPAPPPPVDLSLLKRPIATLAASALAAAVKRKICYLHDAPGCGRSGVSEAHGNDKAAEEQSRVIEPLVVALKNAGGSPAGAFHDEVTAENKFINEQYAHYKATDYSDWHKRDNTRKAMVAAGQRMVATLRNAKPTTSGARSLLGGITRMALATSREREACYRSGAAGCDQQWGLFFEGTGGQKADIEAAEIMNPLAALLADKSPAGLGSLGDEALPLSPAAWVGIVVVGGAITYYVLQSIQAPLQKNSRRRRSSRRTSRRAA